MIFSTYWETGGCFKNILCIKIYTENKKKTSKGELL